MRRVIIAATLGLLAAAAVARATDRVLPDDARMEIARRFFRQGELADSGSQAQDAAYAKAESLADQLVATQPANSEAHFILFAARGRRMMIEDGKPTVANFWKYTGVNEHLTRALELDPKNANALAAKGGILLDLPAMLGGDPKEARQLLERALELNPTGLGTRVTLARALLVEGDREDARKHLLLAAHYACLKREAAALNEAEALLTKVTAGSL